MNTETADLTSREVEIYRLVIRGLSNAQIASAAFVSESTVKSHVSSILAKTGASSRSQLVANAQPAPLPPRAEVAEAAHDRGRPLRLVGFAWVSLGAVLVILIFGGPSLAVPIVATSVLLLVSTISDRASLLARLTVVGALAYAVACIVYLATGPHFADPYLALAVSPLSLGLFIFPALVLALVGLRVERGLARPVNQ